MYHMCKSKWVGEPDYVEHLAGQISGKAEFEFEGWSLGMGGMFGLKAVTCRCLIVMRGSLFSKLRIAAVE